MPSAQETTRGRARRLLRPPWSALGARLHKRTGTHTKAACLVEGITAQIAPPLRAHRSLYFILLDSTAMLSHCLLYHGEAFSRRECSQQQVSAAFSRLESISNPIHRGTWGSNFTSSNATDDGNEVDHSQTYDRNVPEVVKSLMLPYWKKHPGIQVNTICYLGGVTF